MKKIGFGGGCHWCTEAIFQALQGVEKVEQGWIASQPPHDFMSEAVIVHYTDLISLQVLIEIHLLTHSSTSLHRMRSKYRSAIYYFDVADRQLIADLLSDLSQLNKAEYVTLNIPFVAFKSNVEKQLNYYVKNKNAPFCTAYISPKLSALRAKYGKQVRESF